MTTSITLPYEQLDDVEKVPKRLDASFFTLSLISGMVVGFFTLFSTLGINAMVAMVWSSENAVPVLICNALWMVINSAFAIIMLGLITRFVQDDEDRAHMEYRFVVGGILGVGVGWAIIDVALGMAITDAMPFWCALASLLACLSVANRTMSAEVAEEEIASLI